MDFSRHCYHVGTHTFGADEIPPAKSAEYDRFVANSRKRIEPWLSAAFQAEHLNLLLGSGFTASVCNIAGKPAAGMELVKFDSPYDEKIDAHSTASAASMNRGNANIEDQFRSALSVLDGLSVIDPTKAEALKAKLDVQLKAFLSALLKTEHEFTAADPAKRLKAENALQSFLLSFASRAASRERLHIFTSNYDRLIEHGCDLAGLRVIDRFVGALNPVFRSSRVDVDVHYNPPGIRGEPRYMEGVIRFTKLHGSLDWHYDKQLRQIHRKGIPFGAADTHTDVPRSPIDTLLIYPNPAKDVETTSFPYAELFRDFAAAVCRPNAVVVTYGYGFGDDHINRVLVDMLTVPSTHLIVMSWDGNERLKAFFARVRAAQVSLLVGEHFAHLETLIQNYLPKPALDYITARMAGLLSNRPHFTDAPTPHDDRGSDQLEQAPGPQ